MPKSRKVEKVNNTVRKIKVSTKFKIGTRKTAKSGFFMSTDELQAVLGDQNKRKWHSNARAVLATRGAV